MPHAVNFRQFTIFGGVEADIQFSYSAGISKLRPEY